MNRDLKDARMAQKEESQTPSKKPQKKAEPEAKKKEDKKKFVRVAIEEDSEEDDEEPTIEELGAKKDGIDSKFPLKTPREIEAHTREAQILMKNGARAFMDKFEKVKKSKEQAKIQEVVKETPKKAKKAE